MWWSVATIVSVLGVAAVYSEMEISDVDNPASITTVAGVEGNKVDLPCDIHKPGRDRVMMVLWFKNHASKPFYSFDVRGGQPFSSAKLWSSTKALGSRAFFTTTAKTAHLSIDHLKLSDEGVYGCRIDFENSPTTTQKVNLTVIVPPERPIILDSSRRILKIQELYNEGTNLTLICESIGGRPPPKLTWYLENEEIDKTYEFKPDTGITVNYLKYSKLGPGHLNARFICQASNTNLVEPRTMALIVDMNLKPSSVLILTKETEVSAGMKYAVECRTTGSRPDPVVTWWMAKRQIEKFVQIYPTLNNETISILEFVPGIDDDGNYLTCRAENPMIPHSVLEDTWRLNVQYQPEVRLQMGVNLNPDDIKEGDDVYFECIVQANPKVHRLAWFKDGKELKKNATAAIVLSDRSLVLQRVTRNSAGEYACHAANSKGTTQSNMVPLKIMYTPVCKEGKSEVVVGALKQETVWLMCAVESHPQPLTFHWTFNNSGELVDVPQSRYSHVPPGNPTATDSLKEYQQFHGSRLNYTPATEMDYGTVACWATNQVGRQRTPCLFQVIAAGRPYALHNCTATEMSSPVDLREEYVAKSGSGLTVRCIEGYDGGLPIHSYQLEVVGDDDDGSILLNRTIAAGTSGPTFEVAGLTTGRSYRLFLYAVNAKGRSEPAVLEPVTLKGVAMYTGNTDASVLSPLLLGLASIATLLALAVAGILAALYRKHSDGRGGSPKHAPIVCEPPNAGSTTPVHPQTKQAADDIDPDIIPNEYERRPLTYTPVYKTPPQRRRKDHIAEDATSLEKTPIVQSGLDLHPDPRLVDCSPSPTLQYSHNKSLQQNPYVNPPTMADFKQMAMDAYNQRNNQNVYYSLQRSGKGLGSIAQRPVSSSVSAHGKFHQPEVVTRSNRIQESCI